MNLQPYLKLMSEQQASDMYFTTGAPVSVRIEALNRDLEFVKSRIQQTFCHALGEESAMAGNLDVLRLFNPGADVCDPLGQRAIQHGFVH